MIVSFSGIDSAGKTTQIDRLHDYCKANKISVKKVWSKARGTPGVILLKELVRRDKKMDDVEKKEYRKTVFQSPKKQKKYRIPKWFLHKNRGKKKAKHKGRLLRISSAVLSFRKRCEIKTLR